MIHKENYFDINGSTPVHKDVAHVYQTATEQFFGNAGAAHPAGKQAASAIARAREKVARSIGARPEELCFTSGGTESNNWALFSSARCGRGRHMVVSAIEHKSVLRAAQHLMDEGYECTFLPVMPSGHVNVDTLKAAVRDDTFLVSVMLANNETGILQPVNEIGAFCRERGIRFHCDAVSALGKTKIDVEAIGCDLLSLSSHKMYAPKGVGVLYIRSGQSMEPLIYGCGQQAGKRSGTENTPGVVALGHAFTLLEQGAFKAAIQLETLKVRLWRGIKTNFPSARRNGKGTALPGTLNVFFPNCPGVEMMYALGERGYIVSAGAAATNGTPSYVLKAMGMPDERARCSLRFSFGTFTTEASIDGLLNALGEARNSILSPQQATG